MKEGKEICINLLVVGENTNIEEYGRRIIMRKEKEKKDKAKQWAQKAIDHANKYHLPLQKKTKKDK